MPARPYLSPQLPVEGISGCTVNTTMQISDLPQGPPISDEERINSWPSNGPIYSHNRQVNSEAYTVCVYSSSQSTVGSVDERAWTTYPENRIAGVREDDFPTPCNSDPESICQTMSPRFVTSTSLASEGSYFATVNEDQSHIYFGDGDKRRSSWYQECIPIDTILDPNHRYTHFHTNSCSLVSSTHSESAGIYTTPTVAQHRDQREIPQGSKQSEEEPAAESPRSSLRSNWKRGAHSGRYRCTCGRDYAQPQGLTRHRRETHEACICMYCGDFAWARPYRFKEHVKSKHPGIDPDVALEEATHLKTRHGVTTKTKDFPQFAWPSAKTRLYPSSTTPAAMGVPPVSRPAVSEASAGYDSQHGSAESATLTMEKHKYEDARDLSESLGASYDHVTFPPSKQRAQVEKTDSDVGITTREYR